MRWSFVPDKIKFFCSHTSPAVLLSTIKLNLFNQVFYSLYNVQYLHFCTFSLIHLQSSMEIGEFYLSILNFWKFLLPIFYWGDFSSPLYWSCKKNFDKIPPMCRGEIVLGTVSGLVTAIINRSRKTKR